MLRKAIVFYGCDDLVLSRWPVSNVQSLLRIPIRLRHDGNITNLNNLIFRQPKARPFQFFPHIKRPSGIDKLRPAPVIQISEASWNRCWVWGGHIQSILFDGKDTKIFGKPPRVCFFTFCTKQRKRRDNPAEPSFCIFFVSHCKCWYPRLSDCKSERTGNVTITAHALHTNHYTHLLTKISHVYEYKTSITLRVFLSGAQNPP